MWIFPVSASLTLSGPACAFERRQCEETGLSLCYPSTWFLSLQITQIRRFSTIKRRRILLKRQRHQRLLDLETDEAPAQWRAE